MARLRASILVVAIMAAAPHLPGQQPTKPAEKPAAESAMPAAHQVKRGDTLWGLAKTYLGDAYLWPEIYRLNTSVIEDPHWIYPGESLRLPAGVAAVPAGAEPARAVDGHTTTIFDPRRYRRSRDGARTSANLMKPHTAVRAGEYLEAPFVWAVGGPAGAGAVRSTAESQIVAPRIEQRVFQSTEPVFITLPAGATRANGEKFVTYVLGPVFEGLGQVVIPTSIVQLEGDGGTGDARAVISRQFRQVLAGQGVMALDTFVVREDVFPAAVEFGTATKLLWMLDDPVIAQMGDYVVLSSSAQDGFATGDQVSIVAPLGKGAAGETRAPETAAVVQVLRVTPYGVSGIILRRGQGELAIGMAGRVTAKMP